MKSLEIINKMEFISKWVAAILIIVIPVGWHIIDIKSRNTIHPFPNSKYWYLGEVLIRYILSAILFSYAFAKLFGHQLTASVLWYPIPLGNASGFILAWTFFGYSKIYSLFIALGQMAGCVALLYRRTTRLALIILLPILTNIFVMDFTYDGLEEAREMITTLLYLTVFLFFCEFNSFKAFFWSHTSIPENELKTVYDPGGKWKPFIKLAGILLILAWSFGENYYRKISEKHSPIEGAWYSKQIQHYKDSSRQFESNDQAYKLFIEGETLIMDRDGKQEYFALKTDALEKGSVEMSTEPDSLNDKKVKGKYTLITADSLQIMGKQGRDSVLWIFKRRRS